ncbi:MAG: Arc family DNA-binding protein [Coriobacteriaceae bacterium]|uniref:Arc family DNA-binding protein n=1 Tax=Tractidigestivibacter sp. TaxID=2847320 RepID=UPI002A7F11FA|nr:Arc family DNA-binding protein [Tractidigestivibacter sp.]MCI6274634.1 Arc family DNA-binding protein [Coriobacteriaceae bacterium]MCI6547962.1 Arc family DNA-binding protein [Coriobacteriaceae bacterium]MCI6843288.1 Arc family DNA-binding protein [Coriobacteriaceae bacterium]MCI7439226.1 Arc family DNA-binding protein [Coriobacteriaceae bacterium]MDD7584829.1 Arc family DNA-binding protein [Coriobacteriaceae bacterium]
MATRKQYPLRVDPEVWESIERWAEDDMRSANAQVEWILRDALRRAGRLNEKRGNADGQEGHAGCGGSPRG